MTFISQIYILVTVSGSFHTIVWYMIVLQPQFPFLSTIHHLCLFLFLFWQFNGCSWIRHCWISKKKVLEWFGMLHAIVLSSQGYILFWLYKCTASKSISTCLLPMRPTECYITHYYQHNLQFGAKNSIISALNSINTKLLHSFGRLKTIIELGAI